MIGPDHKLGGAQRQDATDEIGVEILFSLLFKFDRCSSKHSCVPRSQLRVAVLYESRYVQTL